MSRAAELEALLATLLVDPQRQTRLLANPPEAAGDNELDPAVRHWLATLDPEALQLAAASFAHKRKRAAARRVRPRRSRLHAWWRRLTRGW
jgi:hypothetical protein